MRAGDLLKSGYCSPMCLLAFIPESDCECHCRGRLHGALADVEVREDLTGIRRVVPLRPEPRFDCSGCGRTIQSTKTHYLMSREPITVLCSRCLPIGDGGKTLAMGSRGRIGVVLGVWP